jgi:uncharacterized protein YjeT (DUF2065 family)
MGWGDFFVGVCLLLIFEGIMPFIAPDKYKEYIKKYLKLTIICNSSDMI